MPAPCLARPITDFAAARWLEVDAGGRAARLGWAGGAVPVWGLRSREAGGASFVQDTTDLLRKLKNIDHLPSNTLLATMDVTSLYTNIPHQNGIQACLTYLQKQDYNPEYRPKDITELIHFILTHNNFTFNNQHFLQMMGIAMGTKMAPQYANLFMSHLEEDFLKNCTIKPLLYLRYIDDIFIIWSENLQSLIEFHQKFNSHHPSI
ncbi:uncharacterized protein LOC132250811 [Alligator mississippiensis]|uniref:uncharacterized protein LOC132250811 n=1 Tax=Alligator mississippiensis TaxID=8496 RepID=UPI002877B0EE|nr:uncharacterized protein LOC132250811 [Alligator mississippiensis]